MKKNPASLARRYGKALFECVLQSQKELRALSFEEYVDVANKLLFLYQKELISFFMNPVFSMKEKEQILEIALDNALPPQKKEQAGLLRNFLKVVLENNRFEILQSILRHFLREVDRHEGVERAVLIAAHLPSSDTVARIVKTLSEATRRKILIETDVDPSLGAGFVLKIGNYTVDASLKNRLLHLKEYLN